MEHFKIVKAFLLMVSFCIWNLASRVSCNSHLGILWLKLDCSLARPKQGEVSSLGISLSFFLDVASAIAIKYRVGHWPPTCAGSFSFPPKIFFDQLPNIELWLSFISTWIWSVFSFLVPLRFERNVNLRLLNLTFSPSFLD